MTDEAPAIFQAIEGSGLGAAIRQSTWAYMVANVGHIVSLMVFFAAVAVMDLRMAGVLRAAAPGQVLQVMRPVAIAGFVGLLFSGATMFIAEASHIILNKVFLFKVGLIVLGLVNVAIFELKITPKVKDIPPLMPLPGTARAFGVASLAIWIAVAISGRSIAYF